MGSHGTDAEKQTNDKNNNKKQTEKIPKNGQK